MKVFFFITCQFFPILPVFFLFNAIGNGLEEATRVAERGFADKETQPARKDGREDGKEKKNISFFYFLVLVFGFLLFSALFGTFAS